MLNHNQHQTLRIAELENDLKELNSTITDLRLQMADNAQAYENLMLEKQHVEQLLLNENPNNPYFRNA